MGLTKTLAYPASCFPSPPEVTASGGFLTLDEPARQIVRRDNHPFVPQTCKFLSKHSLLMIICPRQGRPEIFHSEPASPYV